MPGSCREVPLTLTTSVKGQGIRLDMLKRQEGRWLGGIFEDNLLTTTRRDLSAKEYNLTA